jgi:signal transduction histidine kinase/CheY-like chemotaxis protein
MQKAMKIMARVIGVDRMFIWKNQTIEGKSCFMPIFQWVNDPSLQMNEKKEGFSLAAGSASDGEAKFFQGISINGPLCTFDPDLKDRIACYGAVSVLAIPVILDDYFWGFVSFDDCRQKRFFSSSEEGVLRSSAMLLANAVIRNEMTQSLIQAKEDALAGTKAKSEFLARMSHEIRTPLNAILGFSEAELRNSLSDETRINLEKIYGSGFHLLEIINEILDISKIESGNFNIIPAEYDFPSMVNDVVQLNIVRIGSKPIKFSLIMDETIPARLFGDEVRIKQILNNLLSNSFKYTEKGAVHLAINWEQQNDKAWLNFVVEDTGRGIRKENLEKLFSEYAQFDTAANHRIEGTGLGLAITQRLVQMMEGTITVESEYGKGSIFRVNVPQGIADEKPIGKELADRLMVFDFIKDRSRSPENSFIRSYMPYGKVLVVDDLQINLDVMKELLMSYGIKVDTVLSGQEAVERIRAAEVRYDLVFMDHLMPEMDGLEAVRIIRNEIGSPYAQQIAIIALTANAVTGNKEIFLNNGFDDFISKPIDIKQLDMVLNQWIRDKQNDAVLKGAENQSPGGQEIRGRSGEKQIDLDGEWLLDHPVDGLDFAAALVLYGNSGATYISMLKSFIVHVPLLLEKMNLHLESSLPDYMVAVHGLKGICNTVCAKGTAEFAKELEFASKEGNFDMVRSRHGELGRQVLQLTERLKVLLDKWKRDRPPEEKEKEQRAEPDQELLARLSEAAVECNATLTEGILEELEQYQYVRETELVEWLREQAENFDYDAIHKRLDGLPRNS